MATRIQFRRGTTAQHASFTGAVGEMTVNTDKDCVVVHDGSTSGGFEMARADVSNVSNPQFSGTGSMQLPAGTTAQRPGSAQAGELRYNSSTGGFEGYNGSVWSSLGRVVNVYQSVFNSVQGPNYGFWHSVNALNVTVTPQSSANKFLIVSTMILSTGGTSLASRLLRSGTAIGVGDASSNRTRAGGGGSSYTGSWRDSVMQTYLDSPSTTSSITYSVQVGSHNNGNYTYVNRSGNDQNNADLDNARHSSTLTVYEIAG